MVDVVCYGVTIPGSEGRAGMIAVADPNNEIDLKNFLSEIRLSLPAYAVPLFVRKLRQVDTTGERDTTGHNT